MIRRERSLTAPARLLPLVLLAVFSLDRIGHAQSPVEVPILRIDIGGHTASQVDTALDAGERMLITVSHDNTARIWSVPRLELIGALRPPSSMGKLWAGAIWGDGTIAAVAGGSGGVLIFDVARRVVVQHLDVQTSISALALSRDGTRLAAGGTGVRVWQTSDWSVIGEDNDSRAVITALDFDADGRLSAAGPNALRLYDRNLRRIVTTAVSSRPHQIRFAPDGKALAAAYVDGPLEVRDGKTLAIVMRPDVKGLGEASARARAFSTVAWKADGRELYAGNELGQVFAWSQGGRGARRLLAALEVTPSAILPFKDGRLLLTSLISEFALFDKDGKRIAERSPIGGMLAPANDSNDRNDRFASEFRLSRDGSVVEANLLSADILKRMRFDTRLLLLEDHVQRMPGLYDWSDRSAGGLTVTKRGTSPPLLNGRPLKLFEAERAMSVDAKPGRLLVGGSEALHLFDAEGRELWQRRVEGYAWRVNQSPDGRLVVAALGDSTIRWYRAEGGEELLALFMTDEPKGRRWVAFTPSGYYAAGAGGEDLIGWHIDRGSGRAADFFPLNQFHARFYRPDVLSRVLETLDEITAVRQADAARGGRPTPTLAGQTANLRGELPPVTTIVSPRSGTPLSADGRIDLEVELRSPSGKAVQQVIVRVNGRPASTARIGDPQLLSPPAPSERLERRRIALDLGAAATGATMGEVIVEVLAATDGPNGTAAPLRLSVPGPQRAAAQALPKPRLNAVLVGISIYQQEPLRLRYAAKDAEDLAVDLRKQVDGLYREVNIRILRDAQASRAAVLDALVWLERETTQRDTAILFLAGHGVTEDREFFFLPVDADQDRVEVTSISGSDLRRRISRVPGRVLAMLDTCYAGALAGSRLRNLPSDMDQLQNELRAAETGAVVYSATTGRQRAAELDVLGNGVFTAALLRGLSGAADKYPADGVIRMNELGIFLAEEIKRLAEGRQASTYVPLDSMRDVPLFVPIQ